LWLSRISAGLPKSAAPFFSRFFTDMASHQMKYRSGNFITVNNRIHHNPFIPSGKNGVITIDHDFCFSELLM
jgi:predicted SnoaL-like aldol condensation-catalyzing enzyme